MEILGTLLTLASLFSLCVFLVLKCKIPAGFTPLVVLCAAALWFALFGVMGLLVAGGWLWYGLSAAALLSVVFWRKSNGEIKKLLTPASVFFLLAAIGVLLYFSIRQPVLSEWDEASLWGPIVKLMKYDNVLYTTAEIGWPWPATQTPTLPALSYFFQFFGPFTEWKIYAAYDFLLLGVVAALLGGLSFKQYKLVVPLGLIGLLTPWFFTTYTRFIYVNVTWMSSYGDIPAGMLFGGVMLVYLGLRKVKAPVWPVAVVLAALSLVKDNTFLFALIAAGIISCDFVFFGDKPTIQVLPFFARVKRQLSKGNGPRRWPEPGQYPLAGRFARAVAFFAAAVLPYFIWSRHTAAVVVQRMSDGQVGDTSLPLTQVVILGLKMLFGITPRSEQFTTSLQMLTDAFVHVRVAMMGSGVVIVALILALFAAAILFAKNRALRYRAILAMLLSVGGFIGYYIELIFSYGIVFKMDQLLRLDSYSRYVEAYYIGWFLLAMGFLALAARDGRPFGVMQGVALALCGGMLVLTWKLLLPQYTVIGYSNAFYDEARIQQRLANSVNEVIGTEGTRVFFVSQGDNGEHWFRYSYRLLPTVLDYSGDRDIGAGGGTFGLPGEGEGVPNYLPYTPEMLRQVIIDSNSDYIFIERLDDRFIQSYGTLFADGLAAAVSGDTVLYKVEDASGDVRFVPVEMEVPEY